MLINSKLLKALELIEEISPGSYIVGGLIRDHFINRNHIADVDVAVAANGFNLARQISQYLGDEASFGPLDEINGCGRLVFDSPDHEIMDITTLKAPTIDEDLSRRDFTINAIAVRVSDFICSGLERLIDPLNGLQDISDARIRACADNAFSDDPLRILRAYRFTTQLGFSIDAKSLLLMEQSVQGLSEVSGERIRDELYLILSEPDSYRTLVAMEDLGAITLIFPQLNHMKGAGQNRFHDLDVWNHSLKVVEQIEFLINNLESFFPEHKDKILNYFRHEICPGRNRPWLLKLAGLFHDSGKPFTSTVDLVGNIHFYGHEKVSRQIIENSIVRLKMSNRESDYVLKLVGSHMRLSSLTVSEASRKFLFRVSDRFQEDIIGLSLIFIADLRSSCGPARKQSHMDNAIIGVKTLLNYFFELPGEPVAPLVNGRDIITDFNIAPGPYIGYILKRIREKQALGEIANRQDALHEARRIIQRLQTDKSSQ
ncbi:MAG: HD domain-containing protein [Desulfomonilaceae bacterium]